MIVFLTSDFTEQDGAQALDREPSREPLIESNGFGEQLRRVWPQDRGANVLFVASNPDDWELEETDAAKVRAAFAAAGLAVEGMRCLDHRCGEDIAQSARELVTESDVIFLAGGHGPTENRFLHECHLREWLRDFDGIVIGLSAGSINAAELAYILPELPGEVTDKDYVRFREGLGLTKLQIIPHRQYLSGRKIAGQDFVNDILLPDSRGRSFSFLDDGSYYRIENGVTEFFGSGDGIADGKITPLKPGLVSPETARNSRKLWDALMSEGYGCVALVSSDRGQICFLHMDESFRREGMTDAIHSFPDLIRFITDRFVVEEEKQTVIDELQIPKIRKEYQERGSFVRTTHMETSHGRSAFQYTVHAMDAQCSRWIVTFREITSVLDHDWMTDEYSRTGFIRAAQQLLQKGTADEELALVYCNVKGFRAVNDLFGEQDGDIMIFRERDLLREVLHPLLLGRSEADHYLLLVKESELTPQNLKRLMDRSYEKGSRRLLFTVRCGIYPIRTKSASIVSMIDQAKMTEKSIPDNSGQNYAIYDRKSRDRYVQSRVLLSDYRMGIKEKQFLIYYQPVVSMKSGKLASAEALIRWQHPSLGFLSPGVFIPVLENAGQISAVDRYMIDGVQEFMQGRTALGKRILPAAVNLSRLDFYDPGLLRHIEESVADGLLTPENLKLEVTESAYADLEKAAADFLHSMQEHGIPILLDDYGSGMSSLSAMEQFPFDIVKLDMGLVRRIGTGKRSEALLLGTIGLVHAMGGNIVAEGVETKEQWDFLKDAGCDMVQGYYKYKPMPEEEFAKLLDDGM